MPMRLQPGIVAPRKTSPRSGRQKSSEVTLRSNSRQVLPPATRARMRWSSSFPRLKPGAKFWSRLRRLSMHASFSFSGAARAVLCSG